VKRPRRLRLRACSRCGCPKLYPGRAWEGPVVFVHEPLGSAGCAACGFRGVPIEFDGPSEWRKFALECLRSFWTEAERATPPPPWEGSWTVCAACASPWLTADPGTVRHVRCQVCGHVGDGRAYPSWRAWARELPAGAAGEGCPGEPS
jgi:hypothetical protein